MRMSPHPNRYFTHLVRLSQTRVVLDIFVMLWSNQNTIQRIGLGVVSHGYQGYFSERESSGTACGGAELDSHCDPKVKQTSVAGRNSPATEKLKREQLPHTVNQEVVKTQGGARHWAILGRNSPSTSLLTLGRNSPGLAPS